MTKMKKILLEAGEDEEEADEGDAEAEESKDEESKDEESKEQDELMSDEPFAGLDLRAAWCFGYSVPKESNWRDIAVQAEDIGWDLVDKEQLEKSLAQDVEKSYFKIADFKLTDVDDDTAYTLWFDNNKALWGLEIENSPKAELDIQERADFFKSSLFKKIAKKTYSRVVAAKDAYDNIVAEHLSNGELLLVDVVKLDAILHFLDSEHFLDNLLNGKYLGY